MKLEKTLLITALMALAPSISQACAVDSVSGKTDTTISISWDLSSCNQVNSGEKFEICWKKQGNGGNICIPPNKRPMTMTGTYTIPGLSPSTAYKIRTRWHRKSSWYGVTTRIVTTDPTPTSPGTLLRYEKGPGQLYCVDFYWKNPPAQNPAAWTLTLDLKSRSLATFGIFTSLQYQDLTSASFNGATSEFTFNLCGFSNNRRYRAYIYQRTSQGANMGAISNLVTWN